MKSIAIGCDPNALEYKTEIIKYLESLNYKVCDYGEDIIYGKIAVKVAEAVVNKEYERGILLCGTGIGVCIVANKVPGASAALISDAYSAERAILSNNAKIIALGALTLGVEHAKKIIKVWLESDFIKGGRSEKKLKFIEDYEKNNVV